MKRIDWSEFMKVHSTFTRLAILTAKGSDRRQLKMGFPKVFTGDRHSRVPLSVLRWVLGLIDANIDGTTHRIFDPDDWMPWEVVQLIGIHCWYYGDDANEWHRLSKADRQVLDGLEMEVRPVLGVLQTCTVRKRQWLVGTSYACEPSSGWLIPLDQVDLNF